MSVPHITLEGVKAAIKDIVENHEDVGIQGLDSYRGMDCRYHMGKDEVEQSAKADLLTLSKGKKPRTHVCAIGAFFHKHGIDGGRYEGRDFVTLLARGILTCPREDRGALIELQEVHDAAVGAEADDIRKARHKFRKLAGL